MISTHYYAVKHLLQYTKTHTFVNHYFSSLLLFSIYVLVVVEVVDGSTGMSTSIEICFLFSINEKHEAYRTGIVAVKSL